MGDLCEKIEPDIITVRILITFYVNVPMNVSGLVFKIWFFFPVGLKMTQSEPELFNVKIEVLKLFLVVEKVFFLREGLQEPS